MSRIITVAALQTSYGRDMAENIGKTEALVAEAARAGAQIILPSELFQNIYFCTTQDENWFSHAYPADDHPCVKAMQPLARQMGIVIPVSIFEREGPTYYNSVVMIDADGSILGLYRKHHIPDGPGYQEKYYFRPGDTGYRVWHTRFANVGVGICWDQWFPECARAMVRLGAEVLLYPTAIGSEPHNPALDTQQPWTRAMQGHAVSNIVPVVASNRVGVEQGLGAPQHFYGSSFIADHRGDLVAQMNRTEEGFIKASFDMEFLHTHRAAWGFFRDLRGNDLPF
ncbi:MAG: N-carbamoylputrescine amidase [Alphaproteobacteria bacterium]|nr:N-carbamoylputrescine amidase [Alphaproteobacteria bacterium]